MFAELSSIKDSRMKFFLALEEMSKEELNTTSDEESTEKKEHIVDLFCTAFFNSRGSEIETWLAFVNSYLAFVSRTTRKEEADLLERENDFIVKLVTDALDTGVRSDFCIALLEDTLLDSDPADKQKPTADFTIAFQNARDLLKGIKDKLKPSSSSIEGLSVAITTLIERIDELNSNTVFFDSPIWWGEFFSICSAVIKDEKRLLSLRTRFSKFLGEKFYSTAISKCNSPAPTLTFSSTLPTSTTATAAELPPSDPPRTPATTPQTTADNSTSSTAPDVDTNDAIHADVSTAATAPSPAAPADDDTNDAPITPHTANLTTGAGSAVSAEERGATATTAAELPPSDPPRTTATTPQTTADNSTSSTAPADDDTNDAIHADVSTAATAPSPAAPADDTNDASGNSSGAGALPTPNPAASMSSTPSSILMSELAYHAQQATTNGNDIPRIAAENAIILSVTQVSTQEGLSDLYLGLRANLQSSANSNLKSLAKRIDWYTLDGHAKEAFVKLATASNTAILTEAVRSFLATPRTWFGGVLKFFRFSLASERKLNTTSRAQQQQNTRQRNCLSWLCCWNHKSTTISAPSSNTK